MEVSVAAVLAKAIRKLDSKQLAELLADVLADYTDVTVNVSGLELEPTIPEGYVLVPVQMTKAMVMAAKGHSWGHMPEQYSRKIREMWTDILEADK